MLRDQLSRWSDWTLTFKYLGSRTSVFADQEAYASDMNKHLSQNVFACPNDARPDDAGRIVVDFESFELIGEADDDLTPVH